MSFQKLDNTKNFIYYKDNILWLETAYVMINCEMGAEGTIVEGVKSIEFVKEVLGVFGNYDVVVKLECSNITEIRETIAKKIRQLGRVNCTTTLMCARAN